MSEPRIEPPEVVTAVEHYVDNELHDAEKYDNRIPLDESGVYSLHLLAAKVYALGYEDGERVAAERERRARYRARTTAVRPARHREAETMAEESAR